MTKYYVLFSFLKKAGKAGATPEACAKELNFAVGSVAPYMGSLRTKFGADIAADHSGRKIVKYILQNPDEVEKLITPNRKGAAPKAKKIKKDLVAANIKQIASQTKVRKPKSSEKIVEIEDMEIEEVGDADLASLKEQLGLN